ncbi:BTB/POZ protein [Parasitella parasitica]|nr:BTB/POZ protein [Parasitella parasitica]
MFENNMDPIAFFEHLAATSQSSNEDEMGVTCLTVEKQQKHNMKQLLNSRSLETIKPDEKEEDKEEHEEVTDGTYALTSQQRPKSFSATWHELVASYRLEKEALSQHLKDQLIALEEIEEHFDKANIELHSKIENSYHELSMNIMDHQQHMIVEKQQFQKEQSIIKEIKRFQDEKIKLNVGGQLFETSLTTLRKDPDSMLASMFSNYLGDSAIQPDADNSYFIDRDGTYFRLVLNYLRDLRIPAGVTQDPKIMDELMQEARFYGLNDLLKLRWSNLPVITQGNA